MGHKQRSKRGKRKSKKRVMCPRCSINPRWDGGPCSVCRQKYGLGLPKTARDQSAYRRNRESILNGAERKAVLADLGFDDYAAYLRSDFWRRIRSQVFEEKGKACWVCQRPGAAWQVHHSRYTESALRGESLRYLHPICGICHEEIEIDDGQKRPEREVRQYARKLRHSKAWRASVRRAVRESRERDREGREAIRRAP